MSEISVDSNTYRMLSDGEAIIQSYNSSVPAIYPRNSVFFRGNRVRLAHLDTNLFPVSLNTILIPYSLRTIFGRDMSWHLRSLAFEFGSEFGSIRHSAFRGSSLRSIFIPQLIHFINSSLFSSSTRHT
jgi:hypothetical protein